MDRLPERPSSPDGADGDDLVRGNSAHSYPVGDSVGMIALASPMIFYW